MHTFAGAFIDFVNCFIVSPGKPRGGPSGSVPDVHLTGQFTCHSSASCVSES